MDIGLQDAHVLVTGASGGIGLETARLFLEQGAKVTAHYNTNSSSLQPLVPKFGSNRVHISQADLSDEADTVQLFLSSQTHFGPVQVVIINHAIYPSDDVPLVDMTLDQWTTTMTANLTSSFLVAREYLKQLDRTSDVVKERAAIVLVGSTAGKYGEAGHADYASSKSAMMCGLNLTLKNEIVKIAPKGRVNCVAPGWVRTPMAEEGLKNPDIVYRALATTPLKKVAVPSDVAKQILVLSSGIVSGHVSGQVVMVEGGMEGRLLNSREDVGL